MHTLLFNDRQQKYRPPGCHAPGGIFSLLLLPRIVEIHTDRVRIHVPDSPPLRYGLADPVVSGLQLSVEPFPVDLPLAPEVVRILGDDVGFRGESNFSIHDGWQLYPVLAFQLLQRECISTVALTRSESDIYNARRCFFGEER